jgi:hypothetical protein
MSEQPWMLTSGEPYRLVPHPLDALGKPPPVGPDYETADLVDAVAYADALLRADDLREEADRLREDADRAEDDADAATRETDGTHKALAESYPKLAAAIKDRPEDFRTAGAVRRWLEGDR